MWPFKKKQVEDRATEAEERAEAVTFEDLLLQAIMNKTTISLDEAMEIPSFAGCVDRICDTISTIPIKLYENTKDGITEVKDDARVRLLNNDTGDTLTGPDFKKALVYDYLTNKGGYAFINKRGSKYLSLNYVEADNVSFYEGVDPIFKDYKVNVNGKFYEGFQFLKICRNTKDGYKGVSIVQESNLALTVAWLSLKFEGKLVKRGGNKKGFLESEKKIDKDAIKDLKDGFNKMYSDDNENAIVLNNGVKFHESSNSATEMQLNENKASNAIEICKLFNMPPEIITGGATEEHKKQYIQFCIMPILEVIIQALNKDLLLEAEKAKKFFEYDVTELTKADIKTRYEAYAIGYKNRFLQISEIREMENLPDINIPFFMMGLNDVLYDPKTGDIFMPNMNQFANVKDPSKYPQNGAGNVAAPAPEEDTEDKDKENENEEDKDESNDQS